MVHDELAQHSYTNETTITGHGFCILQLVTRSDNVCQHGATLVPTLNVDTILAHTKLAQLNADDATLITWYIVVTMLC